MTKKDIQQAAFKKLIPHHRGTGALSMGTGKTLLGLMYINKFFTDHIKVLVVAPKISVFKAWKEDAEKFGFTHLLEHITFSTYLSLKKQSLDYDIVVLDEVHNIKKDSHDLWLSQHKGRILGLTGTPPKYKKSERALLIERYCPVRFTYITDDAVEDGILNDYRIVVHSLELNRAKNLQMKTKSGAKWVTSEKDSYDYWTERLEKAKNGKERQIFSIMRMKALMSFHSKEALAKQLMSKITDKVLLFCNTQEQADKLCSHSYHSENAGSDANLELFRTGKINKLSAVLQISEGVNIPGLKECIIMHAYGNERKASQRLNNT